MTTTYVIIDAAEVNSVDFSQVQEDSAETVRYNLNNTKALVKFTGTTPPSLAGKTQYTHTEIRTILTDEAQGWHIADPEEYLNNL